MSIENEQEITNPGTSALDAARSKVMATTEVTTDEDYEPEVEQELEPDPEVESEAIEEPVETEEEELVEAQEPESNPILDRLEELAAKIEQFAPKEQPKEEDKEPNWAAFLNNESLRIKEMKKLNLDPDNVLHYTRYENYVQNVALNWKLEQLAKQIANSTNTLTQYQNEQKAMPIIQETVSAFNKKAEAHTIPKSVLRSMQRDVADLVESGVKPKVAVEQVFKNFGDVVKAKPKAAAPKDPAKVRMQTASAVVGTGNNSNIKSGTAKKGSKASLELVRSKLFSSR